MRGKVIRINAGFYDIFDQETEQEYRTRGSGKLRNLETSPLVGDYVEFEPNGFLTKIYPRRNYFTRPKIANIDQAIIVISLKEPKFSSLLLDKFLMIVEAKKIHPVIIFTKYDLNPDDSIVQSYEQLNYHCFRFSKTSDQNLEALRKIFKNKTSVFMGQSGVGKTTAINLLSNNDFATQAISKALNRGKHTTRVVQIIAWNQGELIDTPGFSSIELELTPLEKAHSYQMFAEASKRCKYKTCIHFNEPENDCNVKTLVKAEIIPQWRYENYLKLLNEVKI
ncbi:ribosome small subunit-dependent GTPase A [Candidatus Mycoplasma pogonae]